MKIFYEDGLPMVIFLSIVQVFSFFLSRSKNGTTFHAVFMCVIYRDVLIVAKYLHIWIWYKGVGFLSQNLYFLVSNAKTWN